MQEEYIENVLKRFNMHQAKTVNCSYAPQFKRIKGLSHKTEGDNIKIRKILSAYATGSPMYMMVCTRPNSI